MLLLDVIDHSDDDNVWWWWIIDDDQHHHDNNDIIDHKYDNDAELMMNDYKYGVISHNYTDDNG